MHNLPAKSLVIAALLIVGGSAIANFDPQGARPIDGELGIDSEGKITGILSADSESVSGQRVSIAIAIGTYATEAEEDAAIAQGINGSKNFRLVSSTSSTTTIDLSAPWAPGVELPLCDKATLIVRAQNLRTNSVTISRNRLLKGQMLVIQSKLRLPDPLGNNTQPTFTPRRRSLRPRSRSLPIDGLVRMESSGHLAGYVTPREGAQSLSVAFAPGRGLTLRDAIGSIEAKTPGYVPFTALSGNTQLSSLGRENTTPDGTTQTPGGLLIIREKRANDNFSSYTYVELLAGSQSKWVPSRNPVVIPNSPSVTRDHAAGLQDILSRSLPIDGELQLSASYGFLDGTITVRSPQGILATYETIDVASVGLESSNSAETAVQLLKRLRKKDPELKNSFSTLYINQSYKVVRGKPGKGEVQFASGQKVALLFRLGAGDQTEYFVSIIWKSGKPPRGE